MDILKLFNRAVMAYFIMVMTFVIGLSAVVGDTVVYGQNSMPFDMDILQYQGQNKLNKAGTDEEKLEFIKAQFLKEMFLKHIFNSNASLLSEEEKQDSIVSLAETEFMNDLMVQLFSELLAKDDVLQLKQHYLNENNLEASNELTDIYKTNYLR